MVKSVVHHFNCSFIVLSVVTNVTPEAIEAVNDKNNSRSGLIETNLDMFITELRHRKQFLYSM